MIAEAGALDLTIIADDNKQLSYVIWVAKYGSRHMAWDQLPPGVRTDLKVAVWHELVEEKRNLTGFDVPDYDPKTPSASLATLSPSSSDKSTEFVEYTPEVSCFLNVPLRSTALTSLSRTWHLPLARWSLPCAVASG